MTRHDENSDFSIAQLRGRTTPTYLAECRKREILDVRIIHGKGTGTLQRTVHAILGRFPEVVSFRLAGEDAGGWGATLVRLRK
ncbi:Smr/MutS family protein [Desulfuromonas versatilis]|uniref:Smr/MutS family protein n=1 Tax=Desulfuromonas versatilis TaxID=2802975 RepID=UPI001C86361F